MNKLGNIKRNEEEVVKKGLYDQNLLADVTGIIV
jgi:hypothetical protein